MRIGAALALIAVGAILRFAIAISVTHGLYLQTIGDILMGVGLLGLILWFIVWAPRTQGRRTRYRQTTRGRRGAGRTRRRPARRDLHPRRGHLRRRLPPLGLADRSAPEAAVRRERLSGRAGPAPGARCPP